MKITSIIIGGSFMAGKLTYDALESIAYNESNVSIVHFSHEGKDYEVNEEFNFWGNIMLPDAKIVNLSGKEVTLAVASLVSSNMLEEKDFKNTRFGWEEKTYMVKGTEQVDLFQLPDGIFLSPANWMGGSPIELHETKFAIAK